MERNAEMAALYNEDRIVNNSIHGIIRPADAELGCLARVIADRAARDMEYRLGKAKSCDKENDTVSPKSGPKTRGQRADGIDDSQLKTLIDKMRKWTESKEKYDGSEKKMYGAIKSFILYVSHFVKQSLSASDDISAEAKRGCRLILPSLAEDFKPSGADDRTRIDIGLIDQKPTASIEPHVGAGYKRLRAVIEAKLAKTPKDLREAFAQLCKYTRQMFAEQYGLRFAFGFTICAGEVCLYHFGNSKIVASAPMDIATREGRCSFIELIANMSLCDISQLGRDPTMRFLSKLSCWQIDCPDDGEDGATKQYYFSNIICSADRLLGRHTRCFPATDMRPAKKREKGESLKATVVIKDAFAFAKPDASEDDRDEVKTLKRIRSEFEGDKSGIMYPKIVVGGRVQFKRGDKTIEDTTSTMYEGVDDELLEKVSGGTLFRAHRRIVLASIGEPLRTVGSVKEFVTVICDAMESHHAIVERCQILHRDISDNNILVVRSGDTVRGLLIDFDCAIDTSKDRGDVRHEMTGTLPYMSFNNISSSNVKRTSLDDCESMLYLLCWYATIGFGSKDERDEAKAAFRKKAIARWRDGDMDSIAKAKLSHLRYFGSFDEDIVGEFDRAAKNSKQLAQLALDLYKALFKNDKFGVEYHGTRGAKDDPYVSAFLNGQPRPAATSGYSPNAGNPFEMRSQEWEVISRDFLDVLARAKEDMVNWVDAPQQPQ
ncbi:hypothetical protein H4S02_008036 [Coemansia sp. RSA 2611]|nr:hypothetical protein H4S02_008036 [Coemansia sp. RSA 2611]